ncbi:hypothetical protein QYE76_032691 [Lolium multiflorum]|uniref:Reverse transcriptase domain-containing protein n=1 Tax=Lolium multiflorum TaxID=4521 RepID=A0AAD8VLM4_LOLMU|nr:hypothetical protein QYE76_032691 [Lolium multiflorum]
MQAVGSSGFPCSQREQDCRLLINLIKLLEEGRLLTHPEKLLRSLTMDALHLSIKENSLYWRTRAKVRYALEGDENTKFFHASATCRLRRNSIPLLSVDGTETSDHPRKAAILHSYYSNLLGTVTPTAWDFDVSSLYPHTCALPGGITAPFTPDEIKTAFTTMNKNSSPGPDGFGPSFYSAFWATISKDVLEVFSSFFDGSIDLTRINRAFLVLLPKIDAAVHPSQFRPISLQNCIMKAITKVLTTRLQAAIQSLVDADQTSFLSGRRISENIVYAADSLAATQDAPPTSQRFESIFWAGLDVDGEQRCPRAYRTSTPWTSSTTTQAASPTAEVPKNGRIIEFRSHRIYFGIVLVRCAFAGAGTGSAKVAMWAGPPQWQVMMAGVVGALQGRWKKAGGRHHPRAASTERDAGAGAFRTTGNATQAAMNVRAMPIARTSIRCAP